MDTSARFGMAFKIAAAAVLLLVAAQLIRPKIPNSPITAEIQAPAEVKQILRKSCYNCHSNETQLAWFDEIVPAYWLVANDVKEARQHVNFSEIGKLPAAQQRGVLFEAVNQIQFGAMPLPSYRRLHSGAAVTPAELAALRAYLEPPTPPVRLVADDTRGADAEFAAWIQAGKAPLEVHPSPNGIEFLRDYKNWKTISSTDRFDNNTIRQILGNDVAVKAVADNHINPWPDGSAFAKVAWMKQTDDKGVTRTGKFYQVEFMIRDSVKYAATKNWGFARWRGTDLHPYGKDAGFASECVGCHTPLRKTDYVFTIPIRPSLTGALPWNPLQGRVITSWIDKSKSTMSTLYGKSGTMLALVTWNQKEDEHWFGAKRPAAVQSVEFVTVETMPDNHAKYGYRRFEGEALTQVSAEDATIPSGRIAYLLSQRAAVMP